jgi:hypothetical protein
VISALLLAAVVWNAPVTVPGGGGPWAAAVLPGWLEAEADSDLGDVRLVDGSGHEVPYRVLDAAQSDPNRWLTVAVTNLRRTADGFAFRVEVPAGEVVDRLGLAMAGREGVLTATVIGGNPPGALADAVHVGRIQGASRLEVALPPTDVGRLEIRLTTLVPGLEPTGVRLGRCRLPRVAGLPRPIAYRLQPAPDDGPWSRWLLLADGPPPRIEALVVGVRSPGVFRRRTEVRARSNGATGSASWQPIGSGELIRIPLADGRTGLEELQIPVRPGSWPRLELRVERGTEAALDVDHALGRAAPRWILFPAPRAGIGLALVADGNRRSRSLERGGTTVDPREAALAEVGPRARVSTPVEDEPIRVPWVAGLFVVAAGLLAWLAWRVLGSPRA